MRHQLPLNADADTVRRNASVRIWLERATGIPAPKRWSVETAMAHIRERGTPAHLQVAQAMRKQMHTCRKCSRARLRRAIFEIADGIEA